MPDDPYDVLGVPPGAPSQEIAEAYRALAQIYHPDRYVEAPARVRAEANTRMQALNAAFTALRSGSSRPASAQGPQPAQSPPPPRPETSAFVHYVDGAKRYHSGEVAPLGFGLHGDQLQRVTDARRCSKLDRELLAWFELQRRNASVPAKQLYQSWDSDEQARYAAKLGCSQIPKGKARAFGVPCAECRP